MSKVDELKKRIDELEAELNEAYETINAQKAEREDVLYALGVEIVEDDETDEDNAEKGKAYLNISDRLTECEHKINALQETWNTKAEQIFSDMEAMLRQKYQIKDS